MRFEIHSSSAGECISRALPGDLRRSNQFSRGIVELLLLQCSLARSSLFGRLSKLSGSLSLPTLGWHAKSAGKHGLAWPLLWRNPARVGYIRASAAAAVAGAAALTYVRPPWARLPADCSRKRAGPLGWMSNRTLDSLPRRFELLQTDCFG